MCSDSECPTQRLARYRRLRSLYRPLSALGSRPVAAAAAPPRRQLAAAVPAAVHALPVICGLPLPSSAVLLAAGAVALAHARMAIIGNTGRLRCSALGRSLLRERRNQTQAVSPVLDTSIADLRPALTPLAVSPHCVDRVTLCGALSADGLLAGEAGPPYQKKKHLTVE